MVSASRVVFETMLPARAHAELPLGALDAGIEGLYGDLVHSAPRQVRAGLRMAILAATWISPLLIRRLPPISFYGQETRERAIQSMGRSRVYVLRQLVLLLKATVCLCYGADPRVRDALGYPPHPTDSRSSGVPT